MNYVVLNPQNKTGTFPASYLHNHQLLSVCDGQLLRVADLLSGFNISKEHIVTDRFRFYAAVDGKKSKQCLAKRDIKHKL